MANPITTYNDLDPSGEVGTRKASVESTGQWVQRHLNNVLSEWESEEFELSNLLCTEWTYDTGSGTDTRTECTQRGSSTDEELLARHAEDVTADMVNYPPIP